MGGCFSKGAQSERTAYKSIGFSLFKLRLCSQNQNKKLQHISGADALGGQFGQFGQFGQHNQKKNGGGFLFTLYSQNFLF
jgi:hypothetical protein